MAEIYGTNSGDASLQSTPDADVIRGWDINNAPGDEGPITDVDWLWGFTNDIVYGGSGGDTLWGTGLNVTLNGGAQGDYLSVDGSAFGATLIGGDGIDQLTMGRLRESAGVIFSIADSAVLQTLGDGTTIIGIEQLNFTGSSGDDNVTGGDLDDKMDGQLGNHVFHGGGGNDTLQTAGTGTNFLFGESGNDQLSVYAGKAIIDGGEGTDTVSFNASVSLAKFYYEAPTDTTLVVIDYGEGAVAYQKITNVEHFDFFGSAKTKAEVIAMAAPIEFRTVSIASNPVSALEGNGISGRVDFTVTLDSASTVPHSVNYVVKNIDTDDTDFDTVGSTVGPIVFQPGETSKVISVHLRGDRAFEPDEKFVVELVQASVGLTLGTAFAESVIVNDDEPPQIATVSVNQTSVLEGDSGSTELTFTLTLEAPAEAAGTFRYNLSEGGQLLLSSDDFSGAISGAVTIEAGETLKTIVLNIQGDLTYEPDEIFELFVVSQSERMAVPSPFTSFTILNDTTDQILGDDNDNELIGGDASDTIDGRGGVDFINGMAGADNLVGGLDSDVFVGGQGADFIDGTYERTEFFVANMVVYQDELNVGGTQGVIVNLTTTAQAGLAAGTARDTFGDIDTLRNINTVIGTSFSDTIYGHSLGENDNDGFYVSGLKGNDILVGGLGIVGLRYDIDEILGGANGIVANLSRLSVRVNGQTTNAGQVRDAFGDIDTVSGFEAIRGTLFDDFMYGGKEENYFIGLGGNDYFNGGAGSDSVSYRRDVDYGGTDGIAVNLSATSRQVQNIDGIVYTILSGTVFDAFGFVDKVKSIEVVYGTNNNDVFFAGSSKTTFHGEAGFDWIEGGNGADYLNGGADDDYMQGGKGNDTYVVDSFFDQVVENATHGTDTIETDMADYNLTHVNHVENLTYIGEQSFIGMGNLLNNVMTGGSGVDQLSGDAGKDKLIGGLGNDELTGGLGADTFVFGALATAGDFGHDIISDFEGGKGRMDVVKIHNSWGFATASKALAALTTVGDDKVLVIDANTSITFTGHANTIFVNDDFLIG